MSEPSPTMSTAARTKSDRMRDLYDRGLTIKEIAARLEANYSFTYAVIKRYREEGAPTRFKESKSEQMRRMYDEGMQVKDIAKEMNANYAFVYGVIKRYKELKEANSNEQTGEAEHTD